MVRGDARAIQHLNFSIRTCENRRHKALARVSPAHFSMADPIYATAVYPFDATPVGHCDTCRGHAFVAWKERTKSVHRFNQHGRTNGIDAYASMKIARSSTHEPFDPGIRRGSMGALRNGIIYRDAGSQRNRSAISQVMLTN